MRESQKNKSVHIYLPQKKIKDRAEQTAQPYNNSLILITRLYQFQIVISPPVDNIYLIGP